MCVEGPLHFADRLGATIEDDAFRRDRPSWASRPVTAGRVMWSQRKGFELFGEAGAVASDRLRSSPRHGYSGFLTHRRASGQRVAFPWAGHDWVLITASASGSGCAAYCGDGGLGVSDADRDAGKGDEEFRSICTVVPRTWTAAKSRPPGASGAQGQAPGMPVPGLRMPRRDVPECQSEAMDFIAHFRREILAFEAAVRRAADVDGAPLVPSCPGWSVSDLVAHLGAVHRYVIRIIRERLLEQPDSTDLTFLELPADREGWPTPEHAPNCGPVPVDLIDWFADGASVLESLLRSSGQGEPAWTWSREQTIGFWLRIQTVEAAVHRWDAENAIGAAQPVEAELAGNAVGQTFEVMTPARRAWRQASPG